MAREILKACARCGRIHAAGYDCTGGRRLSPRKETTATKVRATDRWKRTAAGVKARAFFMCEHCYNVRGKACAEFLEVHHIAPIEEAEALAYEPLNLVCLCNACHRLAERGEIPRDVLLEYARKREAGEMLKR